jgi:3-phosphoshikimate 1-carboxyvinyltransferase
VNHDARRFSVPSGQGYVGHRYCVEPDASAASYFWAAAAITGGTVTVEGLGRQSLQGDVGFCDCLRQMGCRVEERPDGLLVQGGPLRGIDVNMSDISDTVQTLAAVSLFAEGPTRIRGVAHIRHKETDRIGDLARELRKLGARVTESEDGLVIEPRALRPAELETYRDHRMAMSLTLIGLRVPGVAIRDPDCTAKTYPRFFEDLRSICYDD